MIPDDELLKPNRAATTVAWFVIVVAVFAGCAAAVVVAPDAIDAPSLIPGLVGVPVIVAGPTIVLARLYGFTPSVRKTDRGLTWRVGAAECAVYVLFALTPGLLYVAVAFSGPGRNPTGTHAILLCVLEVLALGMWWLGYRVGLRPDVALGDRALSYRNSGKVHVVPYDRITSARYRPGPKPYIELSTGDVIRATAKSWKRRREDFLERLTAKIASARS